MGGTEEPLSEQVPPETRRRRWRRLAVAAAVVVLLLLAFFVPPLVNLGHYRRSIAASMAAALGRPVYVGDMQLQLLPMPGIAMSNVTVAEDPAFGYEPALHANSVVVWLRLTSLWRGRLEVSRISLDEASLNLVRNGEGNWNIASVLLRASQSQNEPTAERHAGAHARFPYIEASDSRIDFKDGLEKKPFSLENADLSMWQAGGGEWRVRLEAQPVRTDLVLQLSDAGVVHVDGSLRRAAALDAMPVSLHAEWSGAQLGQVSRLLAGFDSGWRGDLDATATVTGTLGRMKLKSRMQIESLRRQEFQPAHAMDVDATCQAQYEHQEQLLGGLTCFWPIGHGHLLLTGQMQGFQPPDAKLQLEINRIPASFAVGMLGLMRPSAGNVTATGTVNGSFGLVSGAKPGLTGQATATGVTVQYPGGTETLPALHFVAGSASEPAAPKHARKKAPAAAPPSPMAVDLQPVDLPFGQPEPMVAGATIDPSGFQVRLSGAASVARLISAAGGFGWLENSLAAVGNKGRAELNITTRGSWIGPLGGGAGLGATGTVRVQGVLLTPHFLHAPVEVTSAEIDLTPAKVAWQNAALRFAGMTLRGSMQYPAVCNQPTPCVAAFTLQPGPLDAAVVEASLEGRQKGFFGRIFADTLGNGGPAPWPQLHGQVLAPSLQVGRMTLKNVTATMTTDGLKLTIDSLDGSALGGTVHASGSMTVVSGAPQWVLDARLTGARAARASDLFREPWGTGVVNGETKLSLSGYGSAALESSAGGSFRFTWQKGSVAAAASGPLRHFDRWTASGTVANRLLTLTRSSIAHAGRTTPVRGTIGFDRRLDLTVQSRRGPVHIGGALGRPASAASR